MTSMDSDAPRLNLVLVEDHDILREMLTQALEDAGHQVVALSCAEELEDVAAGQPVDVFLIDLNLPGEDGLSLTKRVRAAYPLAGLIMVTARSTLQDKLEGYARGADMYLTKPIEASELCAVVAAIGRRRKTMDELLTSKSWILSQREMTLTQSGQPEVGLTAAETALMVAFSRAPNQRIAYWQIAETIGVDLQSYAKASLEVRIVRLRKKLLEAGAQGSCIESIRNHGYQLLIPVQVV